MVEILSARSVSRPVTPPAEWVDTANVTRRHRMSMSGWWSICSAASATSTTARIAVGKSLNSMVRFNLRVAAPSGQVGEALLNLFCAQSCAHDSRVARGSRGGKPTRRVRRVGCGACATAIPR